MTKLVGGAQALDMSEFTGALLNLYALREALPTGGNSSTNFTMANGSFSWSFTGVGFTGYTEGVPTQGTVTGITYKSGGVTVTTLTEISANISFLILDLANGYFGNPGVMGQLFFGDDTITGSSVDDLLTGHDGNDIINGGVGMDVIFGGRGADQLTGGIGDDRLEGYAYEFGPDTAPDILSGGDGEDELRLAYGSADGGSFQDFLYLTKTGSANDVFDLTQASTPTGFTMSDGTYIRNIEQVAFYGGGGDDTLIVAGNAQHASSAFGGGAGIDTMIVDLSATDGFTRFVAPGPYQVTSLAGYQLDESVEKFIIHGGYGAEEFNGGRYHDEFYGGDGNDILTGSSFHLAGPILAGDVLDGGEGADTLESAGKGSTLVGGAGDDNITMKPGDLIASGGEGFDLLSVSFATTNKNINLIAAELSAGVVLPGATTIGGFEGLHTIFTGGGNDYVEFVNPTNFAYYDGGAGIDRLKIDLSAATFAVSCGLDDDGHGGIAYTLNYNQVERLWVLGGSENDVLGGGKYADTLSGGAGINELDGGGGNDLLIGGVGEDYLTGGDGLDTVDYSGSSAGISFNLSVTTVGSGGDAEGDQLYTIENLIGSAFNDVLTGTSDANVLQGGAGADTLVGGAGDDTYYVDNAADSVTENLNEGTDTLYAARSWALGSNIEKVVLTGGGDFNVAANGLDNVLVGNSGDNWINGSFGKDRLTGGGGRDSFIFNRTLGPNNIDTITDYDVIRDVIRIDNAVFAGIGPNGALAAGMFHTGAAATEADDRIIYDPSNGRLYFDIDGLGGAAQIHFATLTTKPIGMSATEFIII